MTATPATCGGAAVQHLDDKIVVGGTEVHVITKVGRLVRQRADADDDALGWRPVAAGGIVPKELRAIADDFSASGAFISHAESMLRLGVPAIDTLRMHDADSCGGPGAVFFSGAIDQALDPQGMLAGLTALRDDGTIQSISLGMNAHMGHRDSLQGKGTWSPSVITDILDAAPEGTIDSALLAYGWTLLCHDALEVMVGCQRAGVHVHVAGTFGGDLYSIFRPEGAQQVAAVAQWQALADTHGVSLSAVAIQFAFLPTCVERVIFGMRSAEEVENVAAMEEDVPVQLWREAQRLGLLPAGLRLS
jgi:aryl-alcohol dehydrogenase-like predicted oxidoreductase